jgi:hypothetical protein
VPAASRLAGVLDALPLRLLGATLSDIAASLGD